MDDQFNIIQEKYIPMVNSELARFIYDRPPSQQPFVQFIEVKL